MCIGLTDPYAVVSSEDMLSRIYSCNEIIRKLRENREVGIEEKESDGDLPSIGTMFKPF